MLDEALTILIEILDQVPFRWSQVRRKILGNICECFWGLGRYGEYLPALLESLELNSFHVKDESSIQIRIEKAIKLLDRVVEISFEPYFQLENGQLEYVYNEQLCLRLKIFSKLNSVKSTFYLLLYF